MKNKKHVHLVVILAAINLFSPPVLGQVYKWTDEKGKVHYGDKPPGNAKPVNTQQNTIGNFENERRQVEDQEIARLSKTRSSKECQFSYFGYRDDKGKQLAEAAKKECMENLYRKERDPNYVGKTEAQERAEKHFREEQAHRREVVKNVSTNAKLDEINRKLGSR